MSTFTERAKEIAKSKRMSMVQFQESLGLSISHFYNTKFLSRKVARKIKQSTYQQVMNKMRIIGMRKMKKSKTYPLNEF